MKKEKGNEKEMYRLWVEYLKQSENYKLMCDCELAHMKQDEERVAFEVFHQKRHLTSKAIDALWSKYLDMFWYSFAVFDNIHSPDYSFERWWAETFEWRRKSAQKDGISIISKPYLLDRAEKTISQTQTDGEQDDTMPKWMYVSPEDFVKHMFFDPDKINLSVDIRFPFKLLQEAFRKIVVDQKMSRHINSASEQKYLNNKVPTPITRRLSAELRTYLEVYKLRKNGAKWKDVISQIAPAYIDDRGRMTENGRRLFLEYFKKAKRIIENAEKGIFPGRY